MPIINTDKPIRAKGSHKRLFVVWHELGHGPERGLFWVDGRNGSGRRGFRYNSNGTPHDPNPWGDIENFAEDTNPFEFTEEVTPDQAYAPEKLAAKRRAMLDQLADETDDSIFGIF